ncbi:hypothetical protein FOFC_12557 [Fusarium oxysporum]|nr:hypothetical protein FOFC_12557 [Fusarium oxysporum]
MGIISPVSDLFKRMDSRGILTLCRQSPPPNPFHLGNTTSFWAIRPELNAHETIVSSSKDISPRM